MLQIYLSMLDTEEERSEFQRLYELYSTRMYHVARKYVNNTNDAEDAVHEAFLRVASKSANVFKVSEDKKGAFLFTLVRYIAVDMFNKTIKHREISFDDTLDSTPDDSIPFEELVMGEISHQELIDYINTLPTGMRDVVNMKYIVEMSNRDISSALGITENAIRQRLFSAKKYIQAFLDEQNNTSSVT